MDPEKKKKKKNLLNLFSSSCMKLYPDGRQMGDNPYTHDLLACQEIFRTFFCIKQNENRRQQTFSLTLILLKSIT